MSAVLEMLYIVVQAARGEMSHFNRSTPFNAMMYSLMGGGAVLMVVAALAMGVEILNRHGPARLAISREQAPGHHHGRITELLDTLPLDDRIHYYCCGLESMVNDVGGWLKQNGIQRHQIHREVFFHG